MNSIKSNPFASSTYKYSLNVSFKSLNVHTLAEKLAIVFIVLLGISIAGFILFVEANEFYQVASLVPFAKKTRRHYTITKSKKS